MDSVVVAARNGGLPKSLGVIVLLTGVQLDHHQFKTATWVRPLREDDMITRFSWFRWPSLSCVAVVVVLAASEVGTAQQPYDDLSLFISKFGQPDQIKSSENEKPRPPIVTKQLIYRKEGIRAVYVPSAPVGSPPPCKKWKLLGFQDHHTNEVLEPEEVVRRLQKRQKK